MNNQIKIATIGVFDGLHRGHQFLIQELKSLAAQLDMRPMVVTFKNSPSAFFCPDHPTPLLTTWPEKEYLIREQDVEVLGLAFDADLAQLSAREFLTQLRDQRGVRALLMGYDHHFGSDHADFTDCLTIAQTLGLQIFQAPEMPVAPEKTVSSTRIRQAIQQGLLDEATELLGRPYSLQGQVVHGYGNGHQLGFPTANLRIDKQKCLPMNGVYLTVVGEQQLAICNIGCRPTITPADSSVSVELHIPNFNGDLYGLSLEVKLLRFLRPEHKFSSSEELKKQIEQDLWQLRTFRK